MNSTKQSERVREARASARRPDDGEAFLPDSADKFNSLMKTDGESIAEEYIASALAGEPVETEAQDEVVEEEWGGPFLEQDVEGDDPNEVIPEPRALHRLP